MVRDQGVRSRRAIAGAIASLLAIVVLVIRWFGASPGFPSDRVEDPHIDD